MCLTYGVVWDGLAWGKGMGKALLYGRGERAPDHYASQLLYCGEHLHPTLNSQITGHSLHIGHSILYTPSVVSYLCGVMGGSGKGYKYG